MARPRRSYRMRSAQVVAVTGAALCLLCLSACAGSSGAAQGPDSGVSGITLVDHGCPVLRPSTPCPTHPVRAQVVAVRAGSTETAGRAQSDSDGHFRMSLEPGSYVLQASNLTGAPVPTAMPTQVEVPNGSYVDVTIHFDSGIRTGG